jgi:uncharacterized protein (DUF2236 family)
MIATISDQLRTVRARVHRQSARQAFARLPPDRAVAWTVNSEVALLLGWGRAILLQLAHPKIAAGVAEHSVYAARPDRRLYRFYRTVRAMLLLMFGTGQEVSGAARGILAIHDRVNGRLPGPAGPYPAGAPYSAHDPELLAWVHATLVDSFLLTYETFVTSLSMEAKDRYCREASRLTPLLGVSQDFLPQSYEELRRFFDGMVSGDELSVTARARELAGGVLSPPLPLLVWPGVCLMRAVTVCLLPGAIRRRYGLRCDARMRLAVDRLAVVSRTLLPLLPPRLRKWPKAYGALNRSVLPG